MYQELQPLFDETSIQGKVKELADRISRDYAGTEIVIICVLKAAALFSADLARLLGIPSRIVFVSASSYGNSAVSTGEVVIKNDIEVDISGKHVLIVDTIADSGRTLAVLADHYGKRGPKTLKTAVLLNKQARRTVDVRLDYVGFEVPDLFIVGYGLDYAETYRNLPYLAVIKTG